MGGRMPTAFSIGEVTAAAAGAPVTSRNVWRCSTRDEPVPTSRSMLLNKPGKSSRETRIYWQRVHHGNAAGLRVEVGCQQTSGRRQSALVRQFQRPQAYSSMSEHLWLSSKVGE